VAYGSNPSRVAPADPTRARGEVRRGGMHRIALEGRAVAYGRRQEEAVLPSSGEGVWAMAEEGVGAGAAWQDEPKHRSGGGGREVLGGKEGQGGPECRGSYSVARWAGPKGSKELVKSRSPVAGMGVERSGARCGPGSM
jgi:hypothetical protein